MLYFCVVQGTGENYQGEASRTTDGEKCEPWDSPQAQGLFDPQQLLGGAQNNNKCRNPDSESAPWCLMVTGEYDLCDIPTCVPRSVEDTMEDTMEAGCGADQFQCRPGECIFSGCEF